MSKILEINNLTVQFSSERGTVLALDGISLYLNRGETLGIVGESGSGKSVTALSVMGLLPAAGKVIGGEIWYRSLPRVNPTPDPSPEREGRRDSLRDGTVHVSSPLPFRGGVGGGVDTGEEPSKIGRAHV